MSADSGGVVGQRLCVRAHCPFGLDCNGGALRSAMTLSPAPVVGVCLVDRKIVWANSAAAGFDGLLENDVGELSSGPGRDDIEALVDDTLTNRDSRRARIVRRHDDGLDRQWDVMSLALEGQHQCMLLLRSLEEEVATVVFGRSELRAVITDLSGTVEWATPAVLRAFEPKSIGDKIWELPAPLDLVTHRMFADAVRRPKRTAHERFVHQLDGQEILLDAYVEPIHRPSFDGLFWRVIRVGQDGASPVAGERISILEAAMETIARELERCGVVPSVSNGGASSGLQGMNLLTERERAILNLLSKGLRANAIGERLFLSPSAVRNHLSAIYRKLGVPNQAALMERLLEARDGD